MLTADNLVKVRRVLDLSQTDVAALAEVSVSFINQVEHKKRNLPDRVKHLLIEEWALTPDKIRCYLALYEVLETFGNKKNNK